MTKKLVFAVITARANASEQIQLVEGIMEEAFGKNIDIIVISNVHNASEYNDFIKLEDRIYALIDSEKPDGIILTYDAFMNPVLRRNVLESIDRKDVPKVCIGSEEISYPLIDNKIDLDIEKITDHLIEIHGFNDIDFLSGPKSLGTSRIREEGYRRSLAKHGIAPDDNKIIEGDFWIVSGERTALEYINKTRKIPQAIVCSNDYMAYGLCDTLLENGIRIPQDLTVVGYEYTGDRADHYPVLTTCRRNRKNLGRNAVIKLYELVTGKKTGTEFATDGEMIYGDTCSCGADISFLSEELRERKQQQFYSMFNHTGMLEQYLTESRDISDLISALRRHSYFIPDLSGLYLCLYENWCIASDIKESDYGKDCSMICYTISDIYNSSDEPVYFKKNSVVPDKIQKTYKANACFCCPLFFMEKEFGYMVVRYDKAKCFGESFKNWLKIISNALEFLRMKNDIDYLTRCKNLSDYRDSVTGLSNRAGFLSSIKILQKDALFNSRCGIYMIRTCFSTGTAADTGNLGTKISLEVSIGETVRFVSSGYGKICGRLDDSTFVIAVMDEYLPVRPGLLEDAIHALMYGCFRKHGVYGDDFYTVSYSETDINPDEFEKCIKQLEEKTAYDIRLIHDRIHSPGYLNYRNLRSRIYSDPSSNLPADEACRLFCMSSGRFRVLYKSFFGISYHQDYIFLKILLSRYLLLSTGMSVSSIAQQCGYENDKYFLHQFKEVTGLTPNQYRVEAGIVESI